MSKYVNNLFNGKVKVSHDYISIGDIEYTFDKHTKVVTRHEGDKKSYGVSNSGLRVDLWPVILTGNLNDSKVSVSAERALVYKTATYCMSQLSKENASLAFINRFVDIKMLKCKEVIEKFIDCPIYASYYFAGSGNFNSENDIKEMSISFIKGFVGGILATEGYTNSAIIDSLNSDAAVNEIIVKGRTVKEYTAIVHTCNKYGIDSESVLDSIPILTMSKTLKYMKGTEVSGKLSLDKYNKIRKLIIDDYITDFIIKGQKQNTF